MVIPVKRYVGGMVSLATPCTGFWTLYVSERLLGLRVLYLSVTNPALKHDDTYIQLSRTNPVRPDGLIALRKNRQSPMTYNFKPPAPPPPERASCPRFKLPFPPPRPCCATS